jgi:hypothetical protein
VEQVKALESVKEEIKAKIDQRRIALERWFASDLFGACAQCAEDIAHHQLQIHTCRTSIGTLKVANEDRRQCILHRKDSMRRIAGDEGLPKRSTVGKATNKLITVVSGELASVSKELSARRITLLKDLSKLYIIDLQGRYRTMRGLALPSVHGLKKCELKDEDAVSTALGYLVHRIYLASVIVDFPLKLVLSPIGSRSIIKDRFSVPPLQEYPLFIKTGDKHKYIAAIHMLQDTIFHFIRSRGKAIEQSNDLLELADTLLVRELCSGS